MHLLRHIKCKSLSCMILTQSFIGSNLLGDNEVAPGIKIEAVKPNKDESKRRKEFEYITLMGSDYYSIDYKFDSFTFEAPPDLDLESNIGFQTQLSTGPLTGMELIIKEVESEHHAISLSRNFSYNENLDFNLSFGYVSHSMSSFEIKYTGNVDYFNELAKTLPGYSGQVWETYTMDLWFNYSGYDLRLNPSIFVYEIFHIKNDTIPLERINPFINFGFDIRYQETNLDVDANFHIKEKGIAETDNFSHSFEKVTEEKEFPISGSIVLGAEFWNNTVCLIPYYSYSRELNDDEGDNSDVSRFGMKVHKFITRSLPYYDSIYLNFGITTNGNYRIGTGITLGTF